MGYRVRKDEGRISKPRGIRRPTSKDRPISYLQKCVGGEGTKLIDRAIINCCTHMRFKLLLSIWSSILSTLLCELIRRLCIVSIMHEVLLTITYSNYWIFYCVTCFPCSLSFSFFISFFFAPVQYRWLKNIKKHLLCLQIFIYYIYKYSTINTIFEVFIHVYATNKILNKIRYMT